jgi:hypothetical protein
MIDAESAPPATPTARVTDLLRGALRSVDVTDLIEDPGIKHGDWKYNARLYSPLIVARHIRPFAPSAPGRHGLREDLLSSIVHLRGRLQLLGAGIRDCRPFTPPPGSAAVGFRLGDWIYVVAAVPVEPEPADEPDARWEMAIGIMVDDELIANRPDLDGD